MSAPCTACGPHWLGLYACILHITKTKTLQHPSQGVVTRTSNTRIEVALASSSSSSSDASDGAEEEDALEAWGRAHEHLRLDMLANEATHRRMVEVGGWMGGRTIRLISAWLGRDGKTRDRSRSRARLRMHPYTVSCALCGAWSTGAGPPRLLQRRARPAPGGRVLRAHAPIGAQAAARHIAGIWGRSGSHACTCPHARAPKKGTNHRAFQHHCTCARPQQHRPDPSRLLSGAALNGVQLEAVALALSTDDLALIHGPPGVCCLLACALLACALLACVLNDDEG